MKKVWKYLIISILLLIGLCCVGLLYIFFVPGASLFNLCYVTYNNTYETEKYGNANISQIELKSQNYSVSILPSSNTTIYATMYTNAFGFTTLQHKNASISTPTIENGTMSFTVDEPEGALIATRSYIKLHIPTDKAYTLKISNNRAPVTINSPDIKINELIYTTNNGNLDINNAHIYGKLDLSLGNSYFTLNENTKLTNNNVELDITTGKFDSSKVTLGDIEIVKNRRGVIVVGDCNKLTEDIRSAGGRISVKNVKTSLTVITSDTNVYADTINGSATISLTKAGNASIKNLTGAGLSSITTSYGYIDVENCYSDIFLTSTYGNITIDNAFKMCTVVSSYGNVNINYNELAVAFNPNSVDRKIEASVKNGTFTATGVENININVTGNARLNIKMKNIREASNITVNKGSAHVEVYAFAVYKLKTTSSSGYVNVNLLQINESGGYTDKDHPQVDVNGGSDVNSLTITSTSGSITVIDSELAKI